jgi:YbbR domain-containing protein
VAALEKERMKRPTNEQILYMILSLLIATVMWLYVATAQNPLVERSMSVELHVRGLSTSEVVTQSPSRVQVRLQGPRSALALLSPAYLHASVDLSGLRPGEHRVPVYVATPPEVRVVERTPAEALVVIDTLTQQRLPVEVNLLGKPPAGITLGTPRVTPDHVAVSGPASQVSEVRHAIVSIDTTNVRQQFVTSMPVRLVDANGQDVHGLTVNPPVVEAKLPAQGEVITKVVPVVPAITGTSPAGMAVTAVTATPSTVTITGPGSTLEGIESVTTSPVDLTGVRGTVSRQASILLPADVSASAQNVTVVARVGRALLSAVIRSVPVRVIGAPKGTAARVVPGRVDVQVEGPQDVVGRLTATTLVVQIDAAGEGRGSHRVRPHAVLPPGVRLLAIQPAVVTIVLSSS